MTNEDFNTNAEWLNENIERFYQLSLTSNIEEIDKCEDMIIDRLEYLYNSGLDAEQEWLFFKLGDDYIEIASYVLHNVKR